MTKRTWSHSRHKTRPTLKSRKLPTGEALAREARLVEISRPQFGVAQTGNFCKHVYATLQGLRPSEASWGFEAFRGLPRHSEASRGLTFKASASQGLAQNPFSLQDYEASGTRAYNAIKGVPARPLAAFLLSCEKNFKPQLAPSPLHSHSIQNITTDLEGASTAEDDPAKAILAAASFNFRLLDGPQIRPR